MADLTYSYSDSYADFFRRKGSKDKRKRAVRKGITAAGVVGGVAGVGALGYRNRGAILGALSKIGRRAKKAAPPTPITVPMGGNKGWNMTFGNSPGGTVPMNTPMGNKGWNMVMGAPKPTPSAKPTVAVVAPASSKKSSTSLLSKNNKQKKAEAAAKRAQREAAKKAKMYQKK